VTAGLTIAERLSITMLQPDGNLLDVSGQPMSLAVALGSRPGVIVFYRGGWCRIAASPCAPIRPSSFPSWLTGAFR